MSELTITAEWIEKKRHYLFWRDGNRWAYARLHGGDAQRWDVFDARYAKVVEIVAGTREAAVEHITAMTRDGSLDRLMRQHQESSRIAQDPTDRIDNYAPDGAQNGYYEAANLDELKAKLRALLDEYADIPGTQLFVKALRHTAGFDRTGDLPDREGQHSLVLPFPRPAN
jgi:hypothetical protein